MSTQRQMQHSLRPRRRKRHSPQDEVAFLASEDLSAAEITLPEATAIKHSTAQPLRQAVMRKMQYTHGNHGVQRLMQHSVNQGRQLGAMDRIARLVEYNAVETNGRFTDPDQVDGVLPFTESGWDGLQIGRRLTQLNPAAPRDDNQRCVETSFLVVLIQRGPGAVRTMIENYLRRYRGGLSQTSTPQRIKNWYRRSIRNLTPLLEKIDNQTLSYADLSTLLTEMYDVYGSPAGGTSMVAELSMARREGYQTKEIGLENVTQQQAAAEARSLLVGEVLSCGVDASKQGTGSVGHAVHIGRHPETGKLYFYDPWPVQGDQLIECSDDLKEIKHYFTNPLESEEDPLGDDEDLEIEIVELRTFSIDAKYSPPPDPEAAE